MAACRRRAWRRADVQPTLSTLFERHPLSRLDRVRSAQDDVHAVVCRLCPDPPRSRPEKITCRTGVVLVRLETSLARHWANHNRLLATVRCPENVVGVACLWSEDLGCPRDTCLRACGDSLSPLPAILYPRASAQARLQHLLLPAPWPTERSALRSLPLEAEGSLERKRVWLCQLNGAWRPARVTAGHHESPHNVERGSRGTRLDRAKSKRSAYRIS